jgi:hypothetical protein
MSIDVRVPQRYKNNPVQIQEQHTWVYKVYRAASRVTNSQTPGTIRSPHRNKNLQQTKFLLYRCTPGRLGQYTKDDAAL